MVVETTILCVPFEAFSKLDEIGINTCLILQRTLYVIVAALAVQNKREQTLLGAILQAFFNAVWFIYTLLLIGKQTRENI